MHAHCLRTAHTRDKDREEKGEALEVIKRPGRIACHPNNLMIVMAL